MIHGDRPNGRTCATCSHFEIAHNPGIGSGHYASGRCTAHPPVVLLDGQRHESKIDTFWPIVLAISGCGEHRVATEGDK